MDGNDPTSGGGGRRSRRARPAPQGVAEFLGDRDRDGAAEKYEAFKKLVIPHRQFVEAIMAIDEVHNGLVGDPDVGADFLLITGRSRAGKSTLLKHYRKSFMDAETVGGTSRPVLYVELPPEVTHGALLAEILRSLDVPLKGLRNKDQMKAAVIHHLREQDVELMIIDEYQQLVDKQTARFQYVAADFLKHLLNANACQMVFAGMPGAELPLEINAQAEGRSINRIELYGYDWDDEEDRADFTDFLAEVADQLPFKRRTALDGDDLSLRMHTATDGLVGRAMRIVGSALKIAAADRDTEVRVRHLAESWNRVKPKGVTSNPFVDRSPMRLTRPIDHVQDYERSGRRVLKKRPPRDSFTK